MNKHLQKLKAYVIWGWQYKKVEHSIRQLWLRESKLAMIDGNEMKDNRKIIFFQLQKQILQQLYNNHMVIEKMRLLLHESINWMNMNADIENTMKYCTTYLDSRKIQPNEKTLLYIILCKA